MKRNTVKWNGEEEKKSKEQKIQVKEGDTVKKREINNNKEKVTAMTRGKK